MKFPLLAALLTFLASIHLCASKPYLGSQFQTALKIRLGNKQGAAAYNTAARFVEVALRDRKNKSRAPSYIRQTIGTLQPVIRESEILISRTALARALVYGYFRNRAPDPGDRKFLGAARALVRRLPSSQRTPAALALLFSPIEQYFRIHHL